MRILIFSFILFFTSLNLKAQMDTISYSVGMIIAKNLKSQGIKKIDNASFSQAMDDVFAGKETAVSADEANRVFSGYVESMQASVHEDNKVAGEEFLAKNKARKEVKTTASGLQYEVLTPAAGLKPKLTDKVNVHYHGTLTDGTVFDSSVERGEPISFPLNGVIKGWQEGLQLMPVGSKYRLFIPYDLAYGTRAAGAAIQPYSALIFDVTLLAIE